jgi:hypothetical protein
MPITIPPHINDIKAAGQSWLMQKVAEDEMNLPDYERPLKKIIRKGTNPFQKDVAKHGFMTAVERYIAP